MERWPSEIPLFALILMISIPIWLLLAIKLSTDLAFEGEADERVRRAIAETRRLLLAK